MMHTALQLPRARRTSSVAKGRKNPTFLPRSLILRMATREAGLRELDAMREASLASSRYEYLFWEMTYRQERWPVLPSTAAAHPLSAISHGAGRVLTAAGQSAILPERTRAPARLHGGRPCPI